MKFTSPNEMLRYIQGGNDIWSPELEYYIFLYSELGSICYYSVNYSEAKQFAKLSQKSNPCEKWSCFLGIGGYICDTEEWFEETRKSGLDIDTNDIYDSALSFCEDKFKATWIDCDDVLNIV